jgi:hypothetical protein
MVIEDFLETPAARYELDFLLSVQRRFFEIVTGRILQKRKEMVIKNADPFGRIGVCRTS